MHDNSIIKKFWIFMTVVGLVTIFVSAFLFDSPDSFKAWLFHTSEILTGMYLNPYREKYMNHLFGSNDDDTF